MTAPSRGARARSAVLGCVLLLLALVVAACGDDDGEDDAADEASFCRLAREHEPVDEATAAVLSRMEELAPDELGDAIGRLRELAEELEDVDPDDPDSLALEFEARFDEEFIDARRRVEAFVDDECPRPTTSSTEGTTTTEAATADPVEQDGGE